jgi:hypothetical protein
MLGHTVAADRGADRNEQDEPKADSGHRGTPRRSRKTGGLRRRAVDGVRNPHHQLKSGDGAREANHQPLGLRHSCSLAAGGHPFYQRLNQMLDTHAFDEFVEAQCAPFYADKIGRQV